MNLFTSYSTSQYRRPRYAADNRTARNRPNFGPFWGCQNSNRGNASLATPDKNIPEEVHGNLREKYTFYLGLTMFSEIKKKITSCF